MGPGSNLFGGSHETKMPVQCSSVLAAGGIRSLLRSAEKRFQAKGPAEIGIANARPGIHRRTSLTPNRC